MPRAVLLCERHHTVLRGLVMLLAGTEAVVRPFRALGVVGYRTARCRIPGIPRNGAATVHFFGQLTCMIACRSARNAC